MPCNQRQAGVRRLGSGQVLTCDLPCSTSATERWDVGGLLHHSDQGCTYASEDYQAVLEAHGFTCSMSRRGNCYDNAVMESFFSSVKSEVADRFESCGEAKMELFDYIEVFYKSAFDARPDQPGRIRTTRGTTSFAASEEDRTNGAQLTAHLH
jgi:transposase InsO family protein